MTHATTVIPEEVVLIVVAFASAVMPLALLWIALRHQRTAVMLILSLTSKAVN